jgi:NADH/F420H2 dehydrogenase subunit C
MMIRKAFTNFMSILPIISSRLFRKEFILVADYSHIIFVLTVLKNHSNFRYKLLSCISGVDLLNKDYRFCVSYEILSLKYNVRLRIKTFFNEVMPLISSTRVYICANWWEREIWDMFGVFFSNHPDLRRILTDYGFEGHPLRKDFPLCGFTELRYNEVKKIVSSNYINFNQSYRNFFFENPWI